MNDVLRTPSSATTPVTGVHTFAGGRSMDNLTVAELDTFYVLVGATPVLVHNEGGMEGCSDAAFQTVLHNEQEVKDGNANHLVPGMDSRTEAGSDALADYLEAVYRTPGTPLSNGSGEAWYDPDNGLYIMRKYSETNPGGSVFQAPYSYFLNKTGQGG